jgi:hypothetical protein
MKYDKALLAVTNKKMEDLLALTPPEMVAELGQTIPADATIDYLLGWTDAVSDILAAIKDFGTTENFTEHLSFYLTFKGAVASRKLAELEPKGGELDVTA